MSQVVYPSSDHRCVEQCPCCIRLGPLPPPDQAFKERLTARLVQAMERAGVIPSERGPA